MNRNKEEILFLLKALEIDPFMEHALVNIAGNYIYYYYYYVTTYFYCYYIVIVDFRLLSR